MNNYIYYRGKAYRSDSGFENSRKLTAYDVYNHETCDLDNDLGSYSFPDLHNYSVNNIVWVTKTKKAAKRYGNNIIEIIYNKAIVVGDDNEEGFLILIID